jgi:hypothetical protein
VGTITAEALDALLSGACDVLSKRKGGRMSSTGVVLVDEQALGAWTTVLASGVVVDLELRVLRLRRHSLDSLRVWSSRVTDLPWLETDETAGRVLVATGGWPILVERAVEILRRTRDLDNALADLDRHLETGGGRTLIDAVGLGADNRLRHAFNVLAELHQGLPAPEAADLISEMCDLPGPEADAVWRVLRMIGAVDVDEAAGTVRPESLLVRFIAEAPVGAAADSDNEG